MVFAIGIVDHLQDAPLLVDEEGHPLRHLDHAAQQAAEPRAGDTVSARNGKVGIGEQREIQLVLLAEATVRFLALGRNTDNRRAAGRDFTIGIAQASRLLGAPGRVVHRVEIEDQLAAAEIAEADLRAIAARRREIGRRVPRPEVGRHQK